MKKGTFLLLLIFLTGGMTVSAQIEKSNWFVNGLNIISFQVGSYKNSDGLFGSSKTNFSEFTYGPSFLSGLYGGMNFVNSPTINYGITNKLSGGVLLIINQYSEKDNIKSTASVFAIGPSLRYYFLDEKKFIPFAEGKIGIGGISSKYSNNDASKSGLFAWYLGAGGTYFFKPKIGIDFTLGYGNMALKAKDSQSNSKTTVSLVNIGVGMLVGL